jgi:ribonuclease VapC
MSRKPQAFVLDAWSIIAYLEDEPAAERIADIISNAHEENIPVMMTVVNAGEVWYIVAREISEQEADQSLKELSNLRIQFVDVNWELAKEAARFKARYKMSYADCYAAALAKVKKANLVTGDKEFKSLEDQVKIVWV